MSTELKNQMIERIALRMFRSRLVSLEDCTVTRTYDREAATTSFSFSCDPSMSILISDIHDRWYINSTGLEIGGGARTFYLLTQDENNITTEAGEKLLYR
jgi:hypothetical protein